VSRARPRLAAATLVVLLVGGCGQDEPPPPETAMVGRATVTEVVEAPATVSAKATATVISPANGKVTRLKVTDGQRVKAGQVLLRVDSPQAEAQLEQAHDADARAASARISTPRRADLSATQEQLDQAAKEAFRTAREAAAQVPDPSQRARALAAIAAAEGQFVAASRRSQQAVESFNAGLASLTRVLSSLSEVQRVQTRTALALAERTVDALTVRAPIAGVVSFGAGR
jgi:HlyD family secretion protein